MSSGVDDPGGVSYGTNQLSSNTRTLNEFLDQSGCKDRFTELKAATPAFDAKWRDLARDDPAFGTAQHNFIKTSHYDRELAHLKAGGLDLTTCGPAVQDALWSISVQYRGLTQDIFKKGLKEEFGDEYKLSELSDKEIVTAARKYKAVHNDHLFASSPVKTRKNILNRIESEKTDWLNLADGKVADHSFDRPDGRSAIVSIKQGAHGDAVGVLQANLGALGYTDANGDPLRVDKDFGVGTDAAVRAFQRDHHLLVEGSWAPTR